MGLIRNALLGIGAAIAFSSAPSLAQESEKPSVLEIVINAIKKANEVKDSVETKAVRGATKIRIFKMSNAEGERISMEDFVNQLMSQNPEALKGTAFEKDPIGATLELMKNPENIGKYKLFNPDGEAVSIEEATKLLRSSQISSQTTRPSRQTRYRTETRIVEKLETIIDEEITLQKELEDVYSNKERRTIKSLWWRNIDKNYDFGDKTVRLTSNVPINCEDFPVKLNITCEGDNNQAKNQYLSFALPNRDPANFITLTGDEIIPRKGGEYEVYKLGNEQIKLTIKDYSSRSIGMNRVIESITFDIKGTKEVKKEVQVRVPIETDEIDPILTDSRKPIDLESKILLYLQKKPGSKILDISLEVDSSDETKEILSKLLDKNQIRYDKGRFYPTNQIRTKEEIISPKNGLVYSKVFFSSPKQDYLGGEVALTIITKEGNKEQSYQLNINTYGEEFYNPRLTIIDRIDAELDKQEFLNASNSPHHINRNGYAPLRKGTFETKKGCLEVVLQIIDFNERTSTHPNTPEEVNYFDRIKYRVNLNVSEKGEIVNVEEKIPENTKIESVKVECQNRK